MKTRPLIYEGLSFPGGVTLDGIDIEVRGKGRRWHTERPLAIWRDFTEIPILDGPIPNPLAGSEDAVAAFVSRYGDPLGYLPDLPSHTGAWRNYSALLRAAAHAWDDPDTDGVSRFTHDPARSRRARYFLRDRDMAPPMVRMLDGIRPVAKTLFDFLVLSAALHLDTETPMRRCLLCGGWADASHSRTRFCSNACKVRWSQTHMEKN